ncbi:MAG: glycosyl hydrolase, family 20, partial [Clostridiales bacterium]|nr:glycosyl hydrolase, family 20 [Clostridiales bacterium]
MKLNFIDHVESLIKGINEVKDLLDIELDAGGEVVRVEELDESCVYSIEVLHEEKNVIKYKNTNDFFRALGLFIELYNSNKNGFHRVETKLIPDIGVMVDVSRNAVYKVSTIKNLLKKLALMGHNRFMLYTEDTYEVDGYPYFGYLRGRYSAEELRDIDDFAFSLGIEVIPCIQTLGHLREVLKWEFAANIKDTDEVLLVGEEKTYEFIEAMISTMSKTFRSRNIHIGMDEAFDLGRGKYLTKNGYKHHYELMVEHLTRVCEITRKYSLKPMMWDDMFFRAAAPNSSYYNLDTEISDDLVKSIPEDVSLVYWDYYHIE